MRFFTQYDTFVEASTAKRGGGAGFASSSRNVHASTPGQGGGAEYGNVCAPIATLTTTDDQNKKYLMTRERNSIRVPSHVQDFVAFTLAMIDG